MACSPDPNENLAKAEWQIREAAGRGAQIVCLQELFRSQYFCREENADLFDLAEPIPGPSTECAGPPGARTGRRHRRHRCLSGAPPGVYHNTAVDHRRRRRAAGHLPQDAHPRRSALLRKILLHSRRPGLPQFRHALRPHRRAGVLGPVVSGSRAPGRARRRATFCFTPPPSAGIPARKAQYGAAQHDAWRTIQRSHAIANGVYVAAVNRVGYEGPPGQGLEFWGASFVADPFGQVIAEASHDREEILIVECDPRRIEDVRRNWPFLRDRRIDAYGPILNRWLDMTLGMKCKIRAASACPPNGSRTKPPGSPGRTKNRIGPANSRPSRGCTAKSCANLARVERVRILVEDAARSARPQAFSKECGANLDAVEFFNVPTDRSWTRDYGPIFRQKIDAAKSPSRTGASTAGPSTRTRSKTPQRPEVSRAEHRTWSDSKPGLVLEGGSIDVNGAGKLLTTEECLLSEVQARNPGVSRANWSGVRGYLGVTEVIWLRPRHRRRRYAWACRRSRALYLARYRGRLRSSRTNPVPITSR